MVDELQPKIIALCETKLGSGKAIKNLFPEYEVCSSTKKVGQKGLALLVKLQTFKNVLDATSSHLEDIVAARIEMSQCTLRIILGYAPQETEPAEIREQFFTELAIEVSKCKMADEIPIIVGDLNAKIQMVDGEIDAITSNGKYLLDMITTQELEVLNFHQKCEGKWTHVVRTTGSASVLDYVLVGKQLSNTIKEMLIDEQCLFCPFSIRKRNNVDEPQYSDHNAIISKLEISHEKKDAHKPPKS